MKLTKVHKVSEKGAHQGDIACLLWHNGQLFSTAIDGTVKIWSQDLTLLSEFKAHDYAISDIISNGDNVLTCSNDCQIKEWKKDGNVTWVLEKTMNDHTDAVRKMVLYKGLLYSGDDAGEVRVWDNGVVQGVINVVEEIWDMDMADDKLYTVRDRDVVVSTLNPGQVSSVTIVNTMFGKGPVIVLGDNLIFLDRGGMEIQVHDSKIKGNPLKKQLQGHTMMINAITSDPGRETIFSGGWDEKVVAWDLKSMSKATEVSTDGYINVMAVDGDKLNKSQHLYVGGGNGTIRAYKIED